MMEKIKKHENKIYIGILVAFILATVALLIFGRGQVITIKIVSPDSELVSIESVEPTAKEDLVSIEDIKPVENERSAVLVRSYEDGTVYNYAVQKITEPELILANVKDVTKNNYYTAELESLNKQNDYVEMEITTDMPVENVYYTITDRDSGVELYKGNYGLVVTNKAPYYYIRLKEYQVFESEDFRPEWKYEEITYYMQSGKDSSIKITPNFDTTKRFQTIKPAPKPDAGV